MLRRLWKRHVRGRPDRYQAYVSFPTGADRSVVDRRLADRIDELERVVEGRLDVYARPSGIAVVTDRVPAAHFDADVFDRILERVEAHYAETHSLARLEKWRSIDGELVKSYVVVPVKPLFPRQSTDRPAAPRAPAD